MLQAAIPNHNGPDVEVNTMNASQKQENNFVVKIQLPLGAGGGPLSSMMMVYNKAKTYQGLIPADTGDGQELADIIHKKGVRKVKAYFESYVDQQTHELVVFKERMLPPQPW